ncbi:radical SAM family heme chaperone HemW [uncultured Treponema sp.]|uniref:radical SAM family heme chaperone HemW n=1 Tax=uncultured Treponema sp. TaxID=162155 RepID=UPI0025FBA408|nr:radical SAM family heme chaperone HemW [uncultured Treponema sp.]
MKASLYIHIPFCKKKCDYCDFFSIGEADRRGKKNDLSDSYISSIINETRIYADLYGISEWKSVYTGGGTPSLLSPQQSIDLFSGIKKIAPFSKDCEVTFEMNPDDVTESFLDACQKAGVNRLSMGIQALDDAALNAVNRGSSVEIIMRALEALKSHWNGRLSVDFIAGLPNHKWKSFENQFEILKQYPKIDHVSLYTLTVEENTPLWKKIEDGKINFSFERADRMWIKGRNILEKMGFMQYEVSNFSKKGFESRHNQTYWHQENYIGVGAGASGTWYDFDKKSALRWTNTLSIPSYIESALNRKTEQLDEQTLEFEFLMLGFRCLSGVNDRDFERRFGKSLAQRIGDGIEGGVFSKWQKMRLATKTSTPNGTVYALNRRGILLLNRFLEELM